MPLLVALLSLPPLEGSLPLSLTPQQQKQKMLDVLVRWLFEEAERAPVYAVWEDLHWADPSTLEFLAVCLEQTHTARMLMVLTCRPEFTPPWASHSHVSQLMLSRLGRKQSSAIVEGITGGKTLPREVVQQDHQQDGRGPVVRGRADQDGGGIGLSPRGRRDGMS